MRYLGERKGGENRLFQSGKGLLCTMQHTVIAQNSASLFTGGCFSSATVRIGSKYLSSSPYFLTTSRDDRCLLDPSAEQKKKRIFRQNYRYEFTQFIYEAQFTMAF